MNFDFDALIRRCSESLIKEIEWREEIMKEYDFWDRKDFFIKEEDKKRLKDSYARSDRSAQNLADALKAKDEHNSAIVITIHEN